MRRLFNRIPSIALLGVVAVLVVPGVASAASQKATSSYAAFRSGANGTFSWGRVGGDSFIPGGVNSKQVLLHLLSTPRFQSCMRTLGVPLWERQALSSHKQPGTVISVSSYNIHKADAMTFGSTGCDIVRNVVLTDPLYTATGVPSYRVTVTVTSESAVKFGKWRVTTVTNADGSKNLTKERSQNRIETIKHGGVGAAKTCVNLVPLNYSIGRASITTIEQGHTIHVPVPKRIGTPLLPPPPVVPNPTPVAPTPVPPVVTPPAVVPPVDTPAVVTPPVKPARSCSVVVTLLPDDEDVTAAVTPSSSDGAVPIRYVYHWGNNLTDDVNVPTLGHSYVKADVDRTLSVGVDVYYAGDTTTPSSSCSAVFIIKDDYNTDQPTSTPKHCKGAHVDQTDDPDYSKNL